MTMKEKTLSPRTMFLISFSTAGFWAGAIVVFLVIPSEPRLLQTAEVHRSTVSDSEDTEEARRRLFNFRGPNNKEPDRSTPYEEETAPKFQESPGIPTSPIFQFPSVVNPVGPPPEGVGPVPVTESATNQITGVFKSLIALFNGEGNFGDIVKLAITAFALFGGGSTIASDGFFKIILGLFSKKASFNDILNDAQKPPRRARRRARRGK